MKIFFIGSIHGKKECLDQYQKIADLVVENGHTIKADHILKVSHEDMEQWDKKQELSYHRKILNGIKTADAIFAELSYSSTSVGYLVSVAAQMGKPVVIFYSGKEEPHLFQVLDEVNDKLSVIRYETLQELESEVPVVLDFVNSAQDVRFNFFVSPDITNYLDWVAKSKKVPRSVYLRSLIDQDIEKNDQYTA